MIRSLAITFLAFWSVITIVGTARADTKIDPFFDVYTHMQTEDVARPKAMAIGAAPSVDAFIKTRDSGATSAYVKSMGGEVGAIVADDLMTARLPLAALDALDAREEVVFVEAAKPIETKNDVALELLGTYDVHEGLDMPSGYTGTGVIIGVVDTGIDLNHPDFNNADGASRVIYVWDQQRAGGTGPAELISTYGTECDSGDIASGGCPLTDTEGHGTHISGTAAGRHDIYGGVAPNANIIAVRYRSELVIDGYASPIFSTTICEAVYYVFKKAEKLGMPSVVNLSLGSHIGAHDGTSLFEQCLDSLLEGSSGRAVVAAAGNEHVNDAQYTGLHAGYGVSGDMGTNFKIRSLSQGRIFYLDAWLDAGSGLAFGLAVRKSGSNSEIGSTGLVTPGTVDNGTFDGNKITWQINATETSSPLNGKSHVGITIILDKSVTDPTAYDFDLLVSGAGSFNAWWYPDKLNAAVLFTNREGDSGHGFTYVPGDDRMNVAIPATARNVIAVGGFASRNRWDRGSGCCQVSFTVGEILPFSSLGPSADPAYTGQKPEITAPGAMIASARSSDATTDTFLDMPDGLHTLAAGTSMATPFVTGTIALMLSADPSFTFEDARHYITSSAASDEFTGATPNDAWGYGKLNVLAAVQTAVLGGPTGSTSSASVSLPDGTPGASSSCSMMPGQTMLPGQTLAQHLIPAAFSVLSMAAVIWTTRKRKRGGL